MWSGCGRVSGASGEGGGGGTKKGRWSSGWSVWYGWERKAGKMLEVQRSDFLREGEACNPPTDDLLPPDSSGASVSGWKPAERTVSFNRDVHVKRIGESRQSHHIKERMSAELWSDHVTRAA